MERHFIQREKLSQGCLCSVGRTERKKARETTAGSMNDTERRIMRQKHSTMELLKSLSGMWIFLLIPRVVLRMLQQRCDIIFPKHAFGILYGENRARWRLEKW